MKKLHCAVRVIFCFCVYMADACIARIGKIHDGANDGMPPCAPHGDPLEFWEQKSDTPKIIYCQLFDAINLTINQFNVPHSFIKYELKNLVKYSYSSQSYEDINGPHNYNKHSKNNKQLDNMTIPIDNTYSNGQSLHISFDNYTIKKELYQLKFLNGQEKQIHHVKYTVDWSTGCDDIKIKAKNVKTPPLNGVQNSEYKPVTEYQPVSVYEPDKVSDGPESSLFDQATDEKLKETDGIGAPLIAGIIAVVTLIMLVAFWTFKNCNNKIKKEPFNFEIQYADLQLNETNTAPPIDNYVTYSEIKGVLVPKTNVGNE